MASVPSCPARHNAQHLHPPRRVARHLYYSRPRILGSHAQGSHTHIRPWILGTRTHKDPIRIPDLGSFEWHTCRSPFGRAMRCPWRATGTRSSSTSCQTARTGLSVTDSSRSVALMPRGRWRRGVFGIITSVVVDSLGETRVDVVVVASR
jgi:hypothetical protein